MQTDGSQGDIEFDIVKEVWSSYDLDDGSLLRSRTILTKVLGPRVLPPKGSQVPFGFSFHSLNIVTAKPESRGPPNLSPLPVVELQKLPNEEVDIVDQREDWNLYRLRGLPSPVALKSKVVVTSVFRVTGQFDQEGNPTYIINSTTLVVPARTKELQSP